MAIKFEKLKAGMVVYDVRRGSGIRDAINGVRYHTWHVYIDEVDPVARRALVRWNGNKAHWMSERSVCKYRASRPGEKRKPEPKAAP